VLEKDGATTNNSTFGSGSRPTVHDYAREPNSVMLRIHFAAKLQAWSYDLELRIQWKTTQKVFFETLKKFETYNT
jgi:hypothetical protein